MIPPTAAVPAAAPAPAAAPPAPAAPAPPAPAPLPAPAPAPASTAKTAAGRATIITNVSNFFILHLSKYYISTYYKFSFIFKTTYEKQVCQYYFL
ncbi:MAG TPA: hypothetical protein DCX03_00815 [Bacteroidales bacterium]|nr:hypothetical protein [Bacteroidales bacterium]